MYVDSETEGTLRSDDRRFRCKRVNFSPNGGQGNCSLLNIKASDNRHRPEQARQAKERTRIAAVSLKSPEAVSLMSDAYDYFLEHAIAAVRKARSLPAGPVKRKQRTVARVYHLLSKEAAVAPNIHHLDEFRAARRLERQIS